MATAPTAPADGVRAGGNRALVACTLAWFFDAWDTFLLVYVFTDIAKTFSVSLGTATLTLLFTYSTRWLGGMVFGHIAARYGRRRSLILALAVAGLLTGATGLAPTFAWLIVIRLAYGVGMGGVYAAGGPLATESARRARRGLGSGFYMFGFYAGVTVAPFAYYLIEPALGWRVLFYVGAVSLVLIPYIVFFVPESPVWESSAGAARRDGAVHGAAGPAAPARVRPWTLFGPSFIGITIALIGIEAAGFLSGYPFLTMLPTFLKLQHGFAASQIALAGTLGGLGNMAGALLGGWVSDWFGRRRTYVVTFTLTIIPVVAALAFAQPWIIYIGAMLTGAITGAQGGMITAFENEHFPTELRASGSGFIHNLGSLAGTGASVISVFLRTSIGFPGAIGIFVVAGIVIGLISIRFTRETRGIWLGDVGPAGRGAVMPAAATPGPSPAGPAHPRSRNR